MDLHNKVATLDLELPQVSTPGGSYVSVNVRGIIAYVAIQFPIWNEEYLFMGKLGADLTTEEGYKAAQLCGLNILAQIEAKVGFDRVLGLNHIDAYYQSVSGWDDAPKVVNGASDLFVNALDEAGRHTRAIFGVHNLPRNFSVGITSSFTLKE